MTARSTMIRLRWVLVWLSLFAFSSFGYAQGDATPILVGENAVGTLSADVPTVHYVVTAAGGETVTVRLLAVSPDFAPRFHVTSPAGVEILTVSNPDGNPILDGDASFADAGDYVIEISSENGSTGQFVLSLQAGATLPPAVELVADQPVADTVGGDAPVRVYHFRTTSAADILTIRSETPDAGTLVSLFDDDADKTIATNDAAIKGTAYWLAAEHSYRAEVRAGSADDTAFSICLGSCGNDLLSTEPSAQPTVVDVVVTPEVSVTACTVVSSAGGSVNVRAANGTQYAIVGTLPPGGSLPVLGQNTSSGLWFEVSINGTTGWVAGTVTRLDGDCTSLAAVDAPVGARLAPTQAPPPTNPPPPPPSSGGSTVPTVAVPTAVPTTEPPPAAPLPDFETGVSSVELNGDFSSFSYVVSVSGAPVTIVTSAEVCIDGQCIYPDIPPQSIGYTTQTVLFTESSLNPMRAAHTIRITLDAKGQVAESNENNNVSVYNFH